MAQDDDDEVKLPGLPPNTKNYMTPACYRRLLDEREHLVNVERPEVVNVVSWAASNGDRSENGDYLYGKRRLREIDRRIRFLNKRINLAVQVLFANHFNHSAKFFAFLFSFLYNNFLWSIGTSHIQSCFAIADAHTA